MTSGQRNAFQLAMKAKTANVASAGLDERQDDAPEDRQVAGAVDEGGLLDLARQPQERLAEQERAERRHDRRAGAARGRC